MSTLSLPEKRDISLRLRIYIQSFSSQKKASETITGCSEAYIIAMQSDDETQWKHISDGMWRTVGTQVGGAVDFSRLVETSNWRAIVMYFNLAKEKGASFAIVGSAGWGKSYVSKWFAAVNRKNNVYYLECAEYWNKKLFLSRLLVQMGKNGNGMSVADMMDTLVREIRRQHQPLIILDEIDKLPDPVLKFFITLYNELNKLCGFVWLSTNAIEKRVLRNIDRNTVGYSEIFSRIGATFIQLLKPSIDEIGELCEANGITDNEEKAKVCNEVSQVNGDLRRVDRNILKSHLKKFRKPKTTA